MISIILDDNLVLIENEAFWSCQSLISITIPKNVASIKFNTFYNCSSLTTLRIESISLTFYDKVFWGCSNLQKIYYYGIIEPTYTESNDCHDSKICGTQSRVSCAPFTCSCPLSIVYVPKDYPESSTFCGKAVEFKREL